MKEIRIILALLLFTICQQITYAQQIQPAQKALALQELQNRGITEAEFRAALLKKGVDIDNIKPEQLPQLEPIIKQTLEELEREKQSRSQAPLKAAEQQKSAQPTEDAQKIENPAEVEAVVEQGATVEEAIAEVKADEAKEAAPPAQIYGQEIFRKQSIQLYKTVRDIKPPDSYVLGAGDEVSISIWGVSSADFTLEINEQGYISPSGLPRIFLKGITYGKAKDLLRSRFSQFYVFRPEQFSLSIQTARTITVNISGEVFNYGSFSISAVNTAFNALVAAGGPSDIGSLRNIQLIRDGKRRKVDVYEFLFNPQVQYDFFMENNDILFVPVAERIVGIQGAIKRPFRYELTKGENLIKLLQFAGGLTAEAYTKSIQIQRISGEQITLLDINLQDLIAGKKDFDLQNGDVVSIRNIPGRLENFAEISGTVEFPGSYDLTQGMRVSDLVRKGGLQKETRTDIAFLLRIMPDQTNRLLRLNLDSLMAATGSEQDLVLQPKDRVTVYPLSRFVDKAIISVAGAVRNPLQHPFDPEQNIKVQEAILLAGGLQPGAAQYGYIKRTNFENPKIKSYFRVDLFNALADPGSADNAVLQPKDVLQIYDRSTFTDASDIAVGGSVRNPTKFDYDQSLRISDVVYLSGGLTRDATDFGYLTRTDFNNPKEKEYLRVDVRKAIDDPSSAENIFLLPLDQLEIMSVTTFTDIASVEVEGAVRNPGAYQYDASLSLSDVLTMAGGLKMEAASNRIDVFRVVLQENQPTRTVVTTLQIDKNNLAGAGSNFTLQPFDRIVVRTVPDFEMQRYVTLNGEVRYPGIYALTSRNERISSVIERAGGLTIEAFAPGATLYRTDDNIGPVITRLETALRRNRSRYNYILKSGDNITIPKAKDLVTINLASTFAAQYYPEKMLTAGRFSVAYKGGKRAKWYLDKYTGGMNKEVRTRKRLISVEHPNGQIRRSSSFLFFRLSPKVHKGSIVSVGTLPPKPERVKKEREPANWDKVLTQVLAAASTMATVVLAIAATK